MTMRLSGSRSDDEKGPLPAWPEWKIAAAALWPVVVLASYIALAVLPLFR